MALNPASLDKDLEDAFKQKNQMLLNGGGKVTMDMADKFLALLISAAIHKYVLTTTLIVAPGIPVATVGSPSAQAGATTGPGTGTII